MLIARRARPSAVFDENSIVQDKLAIRSLGPVSGNGHIPRESVALFRSLNACITLGSLAHPIEARNAQLLPAWQARGRHFEGMTRASWAESLMATTDRSFEQNVDLLRGAISDDPAWRLDIAKRGGGAVPDDALLVLPTAALMFWSRPRVFIEATDVLEQLLVNSDLGDDLPVGLFRPPMPACFIRFGTAFQKAIVPAPHSDRFGEYRLQGVYVFDSQGPQNRTLAFIPIFEFPGISKFGSSSADLIISDATYSLNTHVQDIFQNTNEGPHFASIVQIVAKVFFYMQQPQVVRVEEHAYTTAQDQLTRLGAKKTAKLQRQIPRLYDRVVLGPHEALGQDQGELSPHMRRGHFRLQPYGPQSSLRKVIFVAPTWVRPDKLGSQAC